MAVAKKTPGRKAIEPITAEDVAEYNDIQQELARLTKRKDAIASRIKAQLEPNTYVFGDLAVELTKTIGTLNKSIFMHEYPSNEFPELYTQEPSTEAIKETFGEDRAEFYTPTLRLSIKPAARTKD